MNKNTEKYSRKGRSEVRREKSAIQNEEWIKSLLTRTPIATIASVNQDQAFATPISFVYVEDKNAIYFHGAKVGRLRANIDLYPQVSVNVFEMGQLVPDEKAVEFGLDYQSVTIFGKANEQTDKTDILLGLEALMEKFFYMYESGKDYSPIQTEDLIRTGVYKIEIDEWSGKELTSDRTDKFDYKPKGF